jgi:hypothetical protein
MARNILVEIVFTQEWVFSTRTYSWNDDASYPIALNFASQIPRKQLVETAIESLPNASRLFVHTFWALEEFAIISGRRIDRHVSDPCDICFVLISAQARIDSLVSFAHGLPSILVNAAVGHIHSDAAGANLKPINRTDNHKGPLQSFPGPTWQNMLLQRVVLPAYGTLSSACAGWLLAA